MTDFRYIGENHWRARLTDREIELLRELLAERKVHVERLKAEGRGPGFIDCSLKAAGLSYRCIALRFEVSKSTVRDIALERRRVYSGALV